ncbi:caspase-3-like [Ostrea edulis]|uniref:caspase-3-like n=1 Tax=Ostrea edulis TaxID=37623 RepID=UPI0024AF5EBE|nr:caspase-3-like [Ostrea edulis]XP_055999679.1 caspase-3-like [Ostrea edulis]
MSLSVNISKERFTSQNYKTTPKTNGNLCKPVIIDIRKTFFGWFSHERQSASRDIELLVETFQQLGFPDYHLVSDQNSHLETDPLYSIENLKKKLQSIASDEGTTTDSELFLCVVLAFGDSGYFYLPNDPISKGKSRDKKPPRFYTSDLLSHFKGDLCPSLILKPKIFLIQTCDLNLEQINNANFVRSPSEPTPQLHRTPIEADLLMYHSLVSGGYTDKMKKERKESLKNIIDHVGDKNGNSACQFVYTLYKEVKALIDRAEEFEWTDLILRVNNSLMEFIEKKHYESDDRKKPWNIEPRIPVCVDQLTKKLVLKTR